VTNTLYCRHHGIRADGIPKELHILLADDKEIVKTPIHIKSSIDTYIDNEFKEFFGLNYLEYLELPIYIKETMIMKVNELKIIRKAEEDELAKKTKGLG